MELEIYKTDGTVSGETLALPAKLEEITPRDHALYLAVKAQLANRRQGSASTKTRGEVRGGGKKPWRQKGRGVARAGSIRSPIWRHGGRAFGPKPRDYHQDLPKKVKRLARVSALAYKLKAHQVRVVEDFTLENPKTKQMAQLLRNLGVDGQKTLLLLGHYDATILRAGRNLPKLIIREAKDVSSYDLLNCQTILLQKSAWPKLEGLLKR